jgi:MFS family permease
MALGWFLLPRTRSLASDQRFDWPGAALLVPAVGTLMAALSFGHERGFGSPLIIALLVAAATFGATFVLRERRTSFPMVRLSLFRRPAFAAGISSGLLSYLVTFGVIFVVPFYLESHNVPSGTAGLELTALPAALGLVAPLGGRLADSLGPRPVTVAGMLLTAAGLVTLGLAHSSLPALLLELALVGAGLGAFTPANNAAIMCSAPRSESGVAGGILNMTRGLGTSLGVAVTGLVYAIGHEAHSGLLAAGLSLAGTSLAAAVVSAVRGPT